VAGNKLITAIIAGPDKGGLCYALVLDALRHCRYFIVLPRLKRVVFEYMQFGKIDKYNLFLLTFARGLPRFGRLFRLRGRGFLCGRGLFGGLGRFGRFGRFFRLRLFFGLIRFRGPAAAPGLLIRGRGLRLRFILRGLFRLPRRSLFARYNLIDFIERRDNLAGGGNVKRRGWLQSINANIAQCRRALMPKSRRFFGGYFGAWACGPSLSGVACSIAGPFFISSGLFGSFFAIRFYLLSDFLQQKRASAFQQGPAGIGFPSLRFRAILFCARAPGCIAVFLL
jgi:hypothetical protein